jgi:hypothetical protein
MQSTSTASQRCWDEYCEEIARRQFRLANPEPPAPVAARWAIIVFDLAVWAFVIVGLARLRQ